MKKRIITTLLAVAMMASAVTGCGKGNNAGASNVDASVSESDSSAESASEADNSNVSEDDSSSELTDPTAIIEYNESNTKWDGTYDCNGIKLKIGMKVSDILSQGDYAIYTHYHLPSDLSYVDNSCDGIVVAPYVRDTEKADLLINESLSLYARKDNGELELLSEDSVFYYNPYPYTVSLGECIIVYICDIAPEGSEDWDTNGDGELSRAEYFAATGQKAIETSSGKWAIPFNGYYTKFTSKGDEDEPVSNLRAMTYGLFADYPEAMEPYESLEEPKGYMIEREDIDTSSPTYTFTTGYNTFEMDLSYFASITKFCRFYIPDNNYTYRLIIEGTTTDGETISLGIECGCEGYYLPIETDYFNMSYGNMSAYEGSNGEYVYGNTNETLFFLADDHSTSAVVMQIDGTPDSVLSIQHKLQDEIITKIE